MAVTLRPSSADVERHRASGRWSDELLDAFVTARAAEPSTAASLAVADGEVRLSYAELESRVVAVAAALHGLGVGKGDVVSWQLPNWWEAVVLHHAIMRLAAVSNPIVTTNRRREVGFVLAQAQTKVFVHPAVFRGFDYAAMAAELAADLPDLEHTVVVRGEAELGFEALLEHPAEPPAVEREALDPVLLMYTSGTTSDPKGVVHSHVTLVSENHGVAGLWGFTDADRIYMPSPITHITGLGYGPHLAAMLGIPVVLQDVWDAEAGLRLIERHRLTFTAAATPFLHGLTYSPELGQRDVGSLRFMICGGADVSPRLVRDAEAALGAKIARAYGSTEFPTATQPSVSDTLEQRAETDGGVAPWNGVRIVGDGGEELPAGERGEVVINGPERFTGYLVPPAGERVFDADGWFATGDMGRLSAGGHLTIEGRKKDIILRGGENISVKEVEDHLLEHPKIADVAIVAMPDPVLVERACAYVVVAGDEAPALPELVEFLVDRGLAIQKVPERLEAIDALPKNVAGKVQKFKLRAQIAAALAVEAAA